MSAGNRMPRAVADDVIEWLSFQWPACKPGSAIVGSYRRGKPDVGDLEILLPAASEKGVDPVYDAIAPTMDGWTPPTLHSPPPSTPIGSVVSGLKPNFLAASLLVRPPAEIGVATVPLQVFRYTPLNFGWQMIMRTGPGEFGQWFLGAWKRTWGIPVGQDGAQASKDGHLVDASGVVVPVGSEGEAFRRCGIGFIPPEDRDAFVARRLVR